MIRQFCVWHEELRRTIGWLIKLLIKVGARVSYHARRWYIHVASAFPLAHHYHAVLAYGQYLGNSCKSLQNILSRCPRDIP